MKEGMKKRFALLLAAVFALTLVFNGMGANAETSTGSTYNTPTGSTYKTPTSNTYNQTIENVDESSGEGKLTLSTSAVYYLNKNGKYTYQDIPDTTYVKGMTADELYQALGLKDLESKIAQTYQGSKFTGFVFYPEDYSRKYLDIGDFLSHVEKLSETGRELGFKVRPTYGHKIFRLVYYYYPSKVRFGYKTGDGYFLLDKNLSEEDEGQAVTRAMKDFKPVDMTPGLGSNTWVGGYYSAYDDRAYSKTSKFQVMYDILDPDEEYNELDAGGAAPSPKVDSETLKSQVVTAGSKVTLPSTIDGKAVKWLNVVSFDATKQSSPETMEITDNTYVVNSNLSFQAVWAESIDKSQKTKPTVDYLKEIIKDWEKSSNKGETYKFKTIMEQDTIVPKEYLETIKGHNIDLVIRMDGYTWTINGTTIQNASDIDLKVSETNAVPSDAIASLAGSKTTKRISLAHDGSLGFDATLDYYVGYKHEGQFANLYWYKPDGTFEYISHSKIDTDGYMDGYAKFKFTHASNYVIVISDKAMGAKDATAANDKIIAKRIAENTAANTAAETTASATNKATSTSTATKTTTTKTKSAKPATKSPKTGEF